jgi:hypothetical protein
VLDYPPYVKVGIAFRASLLAPGIVIFVWCGLDLSEKFRDGWQYPLDQTWTENYLRWHSDPGSAKPPVWQGGPG